MKKILSILGILFVVTLHSTITLASSAHPVLSGRIVDVAGVLNSQTHMRVTKALEDYEERTSNQLVVVIIDTLDGRGIEEYTLNLARTWGIGQKDKDNGIVLLIAVQDRQVRIEVGYGLEDMIPDAVAHKIIRTVIVPALKRNNYDSAVEKAVTIITNKELLEKKVSETKPVENPNLVLTIIVVFVLFLGWLFISSLIHVAVVVLNFILQSILAPTLSYVSKTLGHNKRFKFNVIKIPKFISRFIFFGGGRFGAGGGFGGGGGRFGGGGSSGRF